MSGEVSKGVATIANAVRTNSDKIVENMVGFVGKIFGADKAVSASEPIQLYKKGAQDSVEASVEVPTPPPSVPNPFGLFDQMVQKVGNILRAEEPQEPLTLYRKPEAAPRTTDLHEEPLTLYRKPEAASRTTPRTADLHEEPQEPLTLYRKPEAAPRTTDPPLPTTTASNELTPPVDVGVDSEQGVLQVTETGAVSETTEQLEVSDVAEVSASPQQPPPPVVSVAPSTAVTASSNEEPEVVLRTRRKR